MDFDLPVDRILYTSTPHYWKESAAGESELDYSARLAAKLEAQIIAEGRGTVVAFIAEPVMGAVVDSIVFCPPMIITADELDEMFAPIEAALDATMAWGKSEGLM